MIGVGTGTGLPLCFRQACIVAGIDILGIYREVVKVVLGGWEQEYINIGVTQRSQTQNG